MSSQPSLHPSPPNLKTKTPPPPPRRRSPPPPPQPPATPPPPPQPVGVCTVRTNLRTWKSKLRDLAISQHRSALHTGHVDIDGVVRLVDPQNGDFLSNCIIYESRRKLNRLETSNSTVIRKKGLRVSEDARFDLMPRISRSSISYLAVGMQKVVTTHADGYIRVWKFSK
ncbi:hypothetical protein Hanom_Chr04g00362021 [Helianthus anomalus]